MPENTSAPAEPTADTPAEEPPAPDKPATVSEAGSVSEPKPADTKTAEKTKSKDKKKDKEKKTAGPSAATDKPVVWPPHHPVRTFFAAIFGIIALFLILAAILTVWFNRTVTDTDTYVRTITPLASQDDVQDFVADRVAEGIVKGSPVGSDLTGIVPPSEAQGKTAEQLQQLGRQAVKKNVLKIVQSPNFQRLWYENNKSAHDKLISQISQNKKEISLDFTPLVNGVMAELSHTQLAPLTQQVVLPDDIGKVNMGGVAIDQISNYYHWLQTATLSLVIAAGLAAAICIALSTHHIRTLRRILMGTGIICLTLALLLQLPSWFKATLASGSQKVAVAVGDVLFHDLKAALVIIGISSIALALFSKILSLVHRRVPKS